MVNQTGLRLIDLIDRDRYELLRPRYRPILSRIRRERRVRVGRCAVVHFESRETALGHVQELLRWEGHAPSRRAQTLEDVRPLVPPPGELRATVMIDSGDAACGERISAALARLGALELRAGERRCASAPTCEFTCAGDPVCYVRWRPSAAFRAALQAGAPASIHASWGPIAALPSSTHQQLVDDLREGARRPLLLHVLADRNHHDHSPRTRRPTGT